MERTDLGGAEVAVLTPPAPVSKAVTNYDIQIQVIGLDAAGNERSRMATYAESLDSKDEVANRLMDFITLFQPSEPEEPEVPAKPKRRGSPGKRGPKMCRKCNQPKKGHPFNGPCPPGAADAPKQVINGITINGEDD